MAEPLKAQYGPEIATRVADLIAPVWPGFERGRFLSRALDGYAALELTGRAKQLADALAEVLPPSPPEALAILTASLGPPHASDELEGAGFGPFVYLPYVYFVAKYALEHAEAALDFQEAVTQRFTAEFSLRAFVDRHPDLTFARLERWTRHPSPHVRRLVSEGTRPLLPWAPRSRRLLDEPERALALLEALKDDPTTVVRRSVANHLNDVAKHHPDTVVAIAARWLEGATPERRALVEHALRGLVKKAHPGALALLGFGARPAVDVEAGPLAPARPRIGDVARLEVTLTSRARRSLELLVDVRVHYAKARGDTAPRVFKLKRLTLAPGEACVLPVRVPLEPRTTRVMHAGPHAVELLVNGVAFPLARFEVRAAR